MKKFMPFLMVGMMGVFALTQAPSADLTFEQQEVSALSNTSNASAVSANRGSAGCDATTYSSCRVRTPIGVLEGTGQRYYNEN